LWIKFREKKKNRKRKNLKAKILETIEKYLMADEKSHGFIEVHFFCADRCTVEKVEKVDRQIHRSKFFRNHTEKVRNYHF